MMRLRTGVKHAPPGAVGTGTGNARAAVLLQSAPFLRRSRNRIIAPPCPNAFDENPCRCAVGCEFWQQNDYRGQSE